MAKKKTKPPYPISSYKNKQLHNPFFGPFDLIDNYPPEQPTVKSVKKQLKYVYMNTCVSPFNIFDQILRPKNKGGFLENIDFPTFISPDVYFNQPSFEQQINKYLNNPTRINFYLQNKNNYYELLARRAYEFAWFELRKEIGETGDNTGPGISSRLVSNMPSYQEITGAVGQAWCASFTSWCYFNAGWTTINHGNSNLALAVSWANEGAAKNPPKSLNNRHLKRIKNTKQELITMKPGYPVVFNVETESDYRNDHVGLFSKWIVYPWDNNGTGLFTSIEGNTGPDVEVYREGKNFVAGDSAPKWESDSGNGGLYGKHHTYKLYDDYGIDTLSDRTVTFSKVVK